MCRLRRILAALRLLFLDHFAAFALVDLIAAVVHRHPALGAVEKIADGDVERVRRRWRAVRAVRPVGARRRRGGRPRPRRGGRAMPSPPVDCRALRTPFPPAVIVAGQQRVGRFLIVGGPYLPPIATAAFGHLRIAQPPARDAHFVHALVADVAVAGVPEPVPVVGEAQRVEGAHRRRAEEQIPVHAGRRRAVLLVADRDAALEAQPFGQINVADDAAVQRFHAADLERHAAVLRTDLHHPAWSSRATSIMRWPS